MGTPSFAVPILKALHKKKIFDICNLYAATTKITKRAKIQ